MNNAQQNKKDFKQNSFLEFGLVVVKYDANVLH